MPENKEQESILIVKKDNGECQGGDTETNNRSLTY